jgi:hypothetical protein
VSVMNNAAKRFMFGCINQTTRWLQRNINNKLGERPMLFEHFENIIFAPEIRNEIEKFLSKVKLFHKRVNGTELLIEYELIEKSGVVSQSVYATSMRFNREGDPKILGLKILTLSEERCWERIEGNA